MSSASGWSWRTSRRDTPAGIWTFTYNQGAALNDTWVVGPSGRSVYRYQGIGTAGPFNVWRTGTLVQRSRYTLTDVELERETFTYTRSDALVNVPVGNPNDPWYDDAVYRPLVSERTIHRDPGTAAAASWTTYFDYHVGDGTYNDYGQPFRIWQWPYGAAREIRRTFRPPSSFTPYIVGRVSTEDVRYSNQAGQFLDANMTWRDYGYDAATGFVTQTRVDGVTTTYTPTSRGNIASTTDARGVSIHTQHLWGVVSVQETRDAQTHGGRPHDPDRAGPRPRGDHRNRRCLLDDPADHAPLDDLRVRRDRPAHLGHATRVHRQRPHPGPHQLHL